MQLKIHSTDHIVTLNSVPARVWEGTSEDGVAVVCFITRIAVREDAGPGAHERFTRELQECSPPSAGVVQNFPLKMVL